MLLQFLNFIRGYLVISVEGAFPERFINLAALSGIHLWGAEKEDGKVTLRCTVKAFRRMRGPAKKSGCRIRIIKKSGLGFYLARYRSRNALILGLALFSALILISNLFIWTVRVDGNENMTDEEIKFVAEYCGLKQGVVKYKVNVKKFEDEALRFEPRLSWIYPEIRGTVLYIHVREKTTSAPPVDVKEPCDVIASRSGVIKSITVKRGAGVKAEGDTVTAGEVLITGGGRLHADGVVIASYWEEEKGRAEPIKKTVRPTGREKSRYGINILGFGMNFSFTNKDPYKECEKTEEERNLKILGDVLLPVTVKKVKFKETYTDESVIPLEKAIEEEKERLKKSFSEKRPDANVINITEEVTPDGEGAFVTLIFECESDIALKKLSYTQE